MLSYATKTRDIQITVRPVYLDGKTNILEGSFSFAYAVFIENQGDDEIQLIRRRWTIRESDGTLHDTEGDTELRAQPVLAPGEEHVYDGSCTLSSFVGSVEGNYLVQRSDGERYRVDIPSFPLQAAAN
ncbi:Co2+/Mg2+ efflux protein ApaG [Longibacter salinarum]|uniref:Co2+/Mg2+ efflux protein ApaG n=1 Tax=Longibacter salinarum TaxID=1850348 RepID=A0A2A8D0Y2_9BACT|nr:Co2+/Mg2+ efflux protein ApaG [Longibacter salinarum]PEN14467.1 Co2+/Mg2+ efflux protein ApaG [Longibacter salinarum]